MKSRKAIFWLGILLANVTGGIGLIIMPIGVNLLRSFANQGGGEFFSFSVSVGLPFAMGAVGAFFWRDLELNTNGYAQGTFLISFFSLFGATFALREGVVCLIMVFPLLWFCVLCGAFVGRSLINRFKSLSMHLTPLYALLIIGDVLSPQNYQNAVADTVVIKAPPKVVWRYLGEFPPITKPEHHWPFLIGVPSPMQSRLIGQGIGARRECELEEGLIIEEKIVAWQPGKKLTFDITHQPDHPELMGHITLQRGQFDLVDNGDGTTTLTGTSWYRLHMYPAAYYDWWTGHLARAVHWRVFEHIKELAEAQH